MNTEENQAVSSIDRLLLDQGFIKMEDLEKARQIRETNLKRAELSLGMIMLKEGFISKKDVNGLLAHPKTKEFIQKELKERGWVDKEALDSFFDGPAELKRLVEDGLLDQEQFSRLIHTTMDRVSFLKLALKKKLINGKALENVLLMKRYNKSVSEILLDEHLVSLSELNYVYRKCDEKLRLGTILTMQKIVTDEQIDSALAEQKGKNLSLGHILLRNKVISLAQLYFALSIQFNTPFRELSGFMYNGKQEVELRDIVGQTYARENGIIPLFVNANNLTLAVSNPSNISKMHELMAMYNHLTMSCVLITDEKFEQLYALLYGEMFKASENKYVTQRQPLMSQAGKWEVNDPASQSTLVDTLYKHYENLCRENGKDLPEGGRDLFFSFIQDNFESISREYDCTSVSFWFEKNDEGPILKASPVLDQ